MNVRKPVDYGTMYRELAAILAQNHSQMNEIYTIGKAISQRPEKGAAAEFLQANFPDRTGFSPRNVRRMRDFYKTYENDQTLLRLAMKIGWTLNVVIMEAELTSVQRISCLQRAAAPTTRPSPVPATRSCRKASAARSSSAPLTSVKTSSLISRPVWSQPLFCRVRTIWVMKVSRRSSRY